MISVVLPVFNRVETVTGCIARLLESPEVSELLVADGGSTDGTIEAIEKFDDHRLVIVSRDDKGIYDAANKAIAEATCDLLWFMNSDDLAEPAYAAAAVKAMKADAAIDYVFGNIFFGSRLIRPRLLRQQQRVWQTMPFPHVSLILRRYVHEQHLQSYDVARQIGGDLDYLNRLLQLGLRGEYIDLSAAHCAPGGISSSNRQIWEARDIAVQHGKNRLSATSFAIAAICWRMWKTRPSGPLSK